MSGLSRPVGVLFVCMGNICRSPTAEGVFRRLLAERGLERQVRVDSAGTYDFHVGKPPDARARAAAATRGHDLDGLCARQVRAGDLRDFDYVLAMDRDNLADLQALQTAHGGPAHIGLLLDYATGAGTPDEVPDPYYGGDAGFERVLDLVEDGCRGLLAEIAERL